MRLAAAAFAATGVLATAFAASGPARADVPKAQIKGVTDNRLRQTIERALGLSKNPPQSRFEARRRAEQAAVDALAALRSEGYYEALVSPDVGEGDQPQSVVGVDAGVRFTLAEPAVSWVNDPPVPVAQIAGKAAIGLTIGGPGRAADVVTAEGRVVAAVQKRGYADAKADPREVIVDHIPHTVAPTFRIDSGPRVMMDGINLTTTGRTRPAWVRSLLPWKPGDIYDPDNVAELEKRLRDTSVYDSITVALHPEPDADGRRPVDVTLVERPKASLELGASYSTAEGTGVEGKWTRYNRMGRGDTLIVSGQIANILSNAGIELDLPNWRRAQRTLKLQTSVYNDHTSAYLERGFRIGADLEHRFGRNDFRTYGISFDISRDEEPNVVNGVLVKRYRPLGTISTLFSTTLDRSDDILNPRRGWRFEIRAEPTVSFGDGPVTYVRTQMQASAYQPLDTAGNTVFAERLRIGSIFNGSIPAVPASRRFYSGGGGSVRGYAYQAVGPRFPDQSPQGGISLIESSFELRRKVAGPIGVVAFFDAGVLGSNQTFELKTPSTAVGIGARYDLGFAPLRADFAVPIQRRSGDAGFQVYLSIGQSF